MGRVTLEFVGGCWDGMNLATDSADPVEQRMARQCYAQTWYGTVGRPLCVSPDYATRKGPDGGNTYVVTTRTDVDGSLLLRLECSDPHHCEWQAEVKRVVVQFDGGCLAGVRLDSASSDSEEALLAFSYYTITEHGRSPSPANGIGAVRWAERKRGTTLLHRSRTGECQYIVQRRMENLGTVVLRLAFTGVDGSGGATSEEP